MKLLILALLVSPFSLALAADDYNGEKILDYLALGTYSGSGCTVQVSEGFGRVGVSIQADGEYEAFNRSLNSLKDIEENADTDYYQAAISVIPDDEYSGVYRHSVEITRNGGEAEVTVTSKRRFLGMWIDKKSLTCSISAN